MDGSFADFPCDNVYDCFQGKFSGPSHFLNGYYAAPNSYHSYKHCSELYQPLYYKVFFKKWLLELKKKILLFNGIIFCHDFWMSGILNFDVGKTE